MHPAIASHLLYLEIKEVSDHTYGEHGQPDNDGFGYNIG
jgi:hypothetical protein